MQGKKDAGEEMGNLLMAGGERLLEANGVSLSHGENLHQGKYSGFAVSLLRKIKYVSNMRLKLTKSKLSHNT